MQYQQYAMYIVKLSQHGRLLGCTELCYDHFDVENHSYSDSVTENLCGVDKEI
jgi:hypothetical protein